MPENPERLAGKVCVITGAAGAIGAAVAGRLEREGATVAGVDQREHAVGALSLRADLTDEEQVRQLFARIADELGRIDVLYNNAGLSERSDHSALDLPLETWERVLAANLTTVFLCCKHGIPSRWRPWADQPAGTRTGWPASCRSSRRVPAGRGASASRAGPSTSARSSARCSGARGR
jgi:NAD(P)-dependent dehydrogenase (short-subunit alcohol dehydrogenase family)